MRASLRKSSCCSSSGVSLKKEAGLSYKVVALQAWTDNNRPLTPCPSGRVPAGHVTRDEGGRRGNHLMPQLLCRSSFIAAVTQRL